MSSDNDWLWRDDGTQELQQRSTDITNSPAVSTEIRQSLGNLLPNQHFGGIGNHAVLPFAPSRLGLSDHHQIHRATSHAILAPLSLDQSYFSSKIDDSSFADLLDLPSASEYGQTAEFFIDSSLTNTSGSDAWRILTPKTSSAESDRSSREPGGLVHVNEKAKTPQFGSVILPKGQIQDLPRGFVDVQSPDIIVETASRAAPRKGVLSKDWGSSLGKRKLDGRVQKTERSCIRCRTNNERCDDTISCRRCREDLGSAKLVWPPCYRSGLAEVIAFRAGNARAGISCHTVIKKGGKWRSELDWDGTDTASKDVALFYPFRRPSPGSVDSHVMIRCRRFIAGRGQVLSEPWNNSSGQIVTLISEPYGCDVTEENLEALSAYIDDHQHDLLTELKSSPEFKASAHNILLGHHLDAAAEYAEEHDTSTTSHALLLQAMSFFARTRMHCARSAGLHQSLDELQVQDIAVRQSLPIPAHLDAQIDHFTIQLMYRTMNVIKRRLHKILFKKEGNENWYEIYLTMFLLLSSLETVHTRQIDVLRRFQAKDDSQSKEVRSISHRMLKHWVASATRLLYHWRSVVKGQVVFDDLWTNAEQERLRKTYRLNVSALNKMMTINQIICQNANSLEQAAKIQLDNQDAKPLAWLSKMWVGDVSDLAISMKD